MNKKNSTAVTSRGSRLRRNVPCALLLRGQSGRAELEGNYLFCRNTMAAGCCGTKKQKLNNSTSIPSCNGTSIMTNGSSNGMVALPEMCFFCFDVLYCQLYNLDPPKTPNFSNDA